MKLLLIALFFIPFTLLSQLKTNKIVMVVSSYGKDSGKTRPGYEMDEFSQAYLILKASGLEIDVASPPGGSVDAGQYNKDKLYNKYVIEDSLAMSLLKNTLPTSKLLQRTMTQSILLVVKDLCLTL